jgi:beta-lactamase class A
MYRRYGTRNINNDIRSLGLSNQAGWINGFPRVTAFDLAIFLGLLEMGELPISAQSRELLIGTMMRNIYINGIPKNMPEAQVANKTGALWALTHDAAIIYSEKGEYILVILSENSNWATVAGLAYKIEAAR